ADAGPAGRGEVAFPLHALGNERVLVTRTSSAPELRELTGQVGRHPVPDLGPERSVVGGVSQIHPCTFLPVAGRRRYLTTRQIPESPLPSATVSSPFGLGSPGAPPPPPQPPRRITPLVGGLIGLA